MESKAKNKTDHLVNAPNSKVRVAILGSHIIRESYKQKTSSLYSGNTGNLLFRFSIHSHIASSKSFIRLNTDPKFVKKNFDIIVIPSANQINPAWDLDSWAKFIEKCDLPVVVFGLGAQAPETATSERIKLKLGTIRYLKVLSERCKTIAVRGEFTANCLEQYGIKNTVVMGCPSIFINPSPNLGLKVQKKYHRDFHKISVASGEIQKSKTHKLVERKLVDLVDIYDGYYICQSPLNLVALSRGRLDEIEDPDYLNNLHNYLMPRVSFSEFISFVRKNFLVFFNVESWLEFMSSCDFSLGKRIHGNVIAMQAETPALVLTHDSRTQELCNTLKMPNMSMESFLSTQGITDLVEQINFDGQEFDNNRIKLAKIYQSIFEANNINCHIPLLEKNTSASQHDTKADVHAPIVC